MSARDLSICERLETLRIERFGTRGKSEMARQLRIRPSTYDRYERDRVPPADLLVKVAEVSDVTLDWLITGEGPKRPAKTADMEAEALTRQFKELLTKRPSFRPVATSLLDWLERNASVSQDGNGGSPDGSHLPIPIVGDVATGANAFWADAIHDPGSLRALLEQVSSSDAEPIESRSGALQTEATDSSDRITGSVTVQTFLNGQDERRYTLIDAGPFGDNPTGAVAWKVTDDGMAPRYNAGDFVIAGASAAVVGQPCIAKRRDSSHASVKIFHREGDDVLLVPANTKFPVERAAESDLEWAYEVLASVRVTE